MLEELAYTLLITDLFMSIPLCSSVMINETVILHRAPTAPTGHEKKPSWFLIRHSPLVVI